MTDRAPFEVHVYACPDDQRPAARQVMADLCLMAGWGAEDDGGQLSLEFAYCAEEMATETVPDICRALREAAPGASFVMWGSPDAFGNLGALFAPSLGLFTGDCDRAGEVICSYARLREVLASVAGRADPDSAIATTMGEPWAEDYRTARQAG
jgi:hypothetical protein